MALTHTNKIRYYYTAGGTTLDTSVTKTQSAGAEANVSESITQALGNVAATTIAGFEFTTKNTAKSVYLKQTGYPSGVGLYINGAGGALIAALDDGVPYVWTSGNPAVLGEENFPAGRANPLHDSITALYVKPSGDGDAAEQTIAVELKVLYDPTP